MQKKEEIVQFLKQLRETIITSFEALEKTTRFERKPWNYQKGSGGGEIALLRGEVFEKAAVNWSGISGEEFPSSEAKGPFFATGLSLITHMHNPHAPTVHFNIRYIEVGKRFWFAGGYDLTPMGFFYEEDSLHFHKVAKTTLDRFDPDLYPLFSQKAKEYFYLPHRQKERGIGGIFFDHYNTGDWKKDYQLWSTIGTSFLETIAPIYQKRIHEPFTPGEKEKQLELRGHYVEFNLLYDRGTKFGFVSQGNPEAILCSLPPLARW